MKKLILWLLPLALSLPPLPALAYIPYQYIAKTYTELLGRGPDPTGWYNAANNFANAGCTVQTLTNWGTASFQPNTEFTIKNYPSPTIVLLSYRAILNREPYIGELQIYSNYLNTGGTPLGLAYALYSSVEFAQLAPWICGGGSYGFGSIYLDGNNNQQFQASPIPSPNINANGTQYIAFIDQDQLQQNLINNRGGTVSLPQGAVVLMTHPLLIPSGTALTTAGQPSPNDHGLMARLVRASGFEDELVKICPDVDYVMGYQVVNPSDAPNSAKAPDGLPHCNYGNAITTGYGGALTNIWIDGERGGAVINNTIGPDAPISYHFNSLNIKVYSGNGSIAANNFISNSSGWSSIQIEGSHELYDSTTGSTIHCGAVNNGAFSGSRTYAQVTGNTVTAYPSRHQFNNDSFSYADGITSSCDGAFIYNNTVVDATDAGIVNSRACPGSQHSYVVYNTVISAGNSATNAIGASPLHPSPGDTCAYYSNAVPDYNSADATPSFSGLVIENNHFWSGQNTHFIIALAVGDAAWFFPNNYFGDGSYATVSNNDSAGLTVSTSTNTLVWGMTNATVSGNSAQQTTGNSFYTVSSNCPLGDFIVVQGSGGSTPGGTVVPQPSGLCMAEINTPPPTWLGYQVGY